MQKIHTSQLTHESFSWCPMQLCTVCCCLVFVAGPLMMTLRTAERGRAASVGYGCHTDPFGNYVSLLIRITETSHGSPYVFELLHGSAHTDLIGPKVSHFQKYCTRLICGADLYSKLMNCSLHSLETKINPLFQFRVCTQYNLTFWR